MTILDARHFSRASLAPVDATDLPAGIIGRMQGVALVYDVIDAHGTTFAPGALARTMRERVPAGKVKLFWDHGDAHVSGSYDTDLHVGIVRRMWDTEHMGRRVSMMEADLFDTAEGRKAHDYLRAVHAAGGETGLSIGMLPDTVKWDEVMVEGVRTVRFKECGLREISITAEPSVPGTVTTFVRTDADPPPDPPNDPDDDPVDFGPLLRGVLAAMGAESFRALSRALLGDATEHSDSNAASGAPAPTDSDAAPVDSPAPTQVEPVYVSVDERLQLVRALSLELY